MLHAVPVENFGGLNLRDDPEEIGLGAAIDMRDVDISLRGRVRQRFGFSKWGSAAAATYQELAAHTPLGTSSQLLAGRAGSLDAISAATAVLATATGGNASTGWSFQSIGTPSAQYTYAFGSDVLGLAYVKKRWDGAAFQTTAASDGRYLALSPTDNRLVVAGHHTYPSRVRFSDAGDPETFGTNNYVDLTPGDGEQITAALAWRDSLFVFKSTKYFVFYGNSVDGTGQPIFNYRTVSTGVGATRWTEVAAAPEGVYFVDKSGIYLTSGGEPVLVSGLINSMFDATQPTPAFYQAAASAAPGSMTLLWDNRRLYCVSRTGNGMLVFDIDAQAWMPWTISANGLARASQGVYFSYDGASSTTSTNNIGLLSPHLTADAGVAITSYYRSGFSDLGYPGQEKTIRETELTGIGSVSLGWSRDFGAVTTPSTATVVLGTSPATARKLHRNSQDGETLSWQVSSVAGGAWTLNRLVPFVRDVRGPAETTT